MDEEVFNMSLRKFLKQLGVTAQREIETGVRERLESGQLTGEERLSTQATVTVSGLGEDIVVSGEIRLQ